MQLIWCNSKADSTVWMGEDGGFPPLCKMDRRRRK